MKTCTVTLPDGSSREIPAPGPEAASSLADWLDLNGLPLNVRCGRRGLCRSCTVEVLTLEQTAPQVVKACQVAASVLCHRLVEVRIPRLSLADKSLFGVSAFTLCSPPQASPTGRRGLGVALDLGTTTLAAALWHLESGTCLGTATCANPQRRYGDDVLSRISYSLEDEQALGRLRHALLHEGLIPLIEGCLLSARHSGQEITRFTVAGNPTIVQTFTGDSLAGLARYPFSLAWSGERLLPAHTPGWDFEGDIHILPALGPFVGGDIVAGALASGLLDDDRTTLLVDFGTNGEILLRHQGKYLATATAAGPAFEGGRLRCGATAREGVVSSLSLSQQGHWQLLGADGHPLPTAHGFSGAAYVDFLALAVASGLLTPLGRFNQVHPLWHAQGKREHGEAFLEFPFGLTISEADVAELLQAKAAMGAGLQVLLETAGLHCADLQRVIIAGGFGYHLNLAHAQQIGLLPDVPPERCEIVGNSSLAGASLCLQCNLEQKMIDLSNAAQVVELNQIPSFANAYADCLNLEPLSWRDWD